MIWFITVDADTGYRSFLIDAKTAAQRDQLAAAVINADPSSNIITVSIGNHSTSFKDWGPGTYYWVAFRDALLLFSSSPRRFQTDTDSIYVAFVTSALQMLGILLGAVLLSEIVLIKQRMAVITFRASEMKVLVLSWCFWASENSERKVSWGVRDVGLH